MTTPISAPHQKPIQLLAHPYCRNQAHHCADQLPDGAQEPKRRFLFFFFSSFLPGKPSIPVALLFLHLVGALNRSSSSPSSSRRKWPALSSLLAARNDPLAIGRNVMTAGAMDMMGRPFSFRVFLISASVSSSGRAQQLHLVIAGPARALFFSFSFLLLPRRMRRVDST